MPDVLVRLRTAPGERGTIVVVRGTHRWRYGLRSMRAHGCAATPCAVCRLRVCLHASGRKHDETALARTKRRSADRPHRACLFLFISFLCLLSPVPGVDPRMRLLGLELGTCLSLLHHASQDAEQKAKKKEQNGIEKQRRDEDEDDRLEQVAGPPETELIDEPPKTELIDEPPKTELMSPHARPGTAPHAGQGSVQYAMRTDGGSAVLVHACALGASGRRARQRRVLVEPGHASAGAPSRRPAHGRAAERPYVIESPTREAAGRPSATRHAPTRSRRASICIHIGVRGALSAPSLAITRTRSRAEPRQS